MSLCRLYTIGYSGFLPEDFLAALRRASVGEVLDVRSVPYSMRFAAYNRESLERALRGKGIGYLFLGDLLGARPENPEVRAQDGAVDFEKMKLAPFFQNGCRKILQELEKCPVCLLCAEKDPANCHRAILVAQSVHGLEPEIRIGHIKPAKADPEKDAADRPLAKIESHEALGERLRKRYDLGTGNFFEQRKSYAEYVDEAFRKRGKEIAFRDPDGEEE